jgi:hypothetical protein
MPVCKGIKITEHGVFVDMYFDRAKSHKLVQTASGLETVSELSPYSKDLTDIELRDLQERSNGQETLRDPQGKTLSFAEVFSCLNVASKFHEVGASHFIGYMDFAVQSPAAAAFDVENRFKRA